MNKYKQVILVRKDLKLSKGKLGAQVAHAAVEATLNSNKQKILDWRNMGMKKVILKVEDRKELLKYQRLAKKEKLVASIIKDAGKTEIPAGTMTCLGIGPDKEEIIDKITGKLKIM
ncbi:peptidyl-tRNA hydrolase [Candidatus Woesearchaeota archaeon]|jgi:PTH2 family peptidyl-tRNA hydrolase|nr:peptidyl-tRNA hydrolase [Candidatus Woesearchaeota archaeon]MBT4835569.1 peptidyl-tRNA hydrolase [Candidatus Woesearchaeota archaeon]MBT6734941.1 peptidyl-tRNA hydrolase [Candidatus Woesearchaeota archaeon]MBT7169762.1 peptidyl-tRNA hydrolase [Candidatus Woesearchaeota archaeon]MBT7474426.1 peptidyl-tRNA hydrolase [Candidatus Woesearchaeota archaeon]